MASGGLRTRFWRGSAGELGDVRIDNRILSGKSGTSGHLVGVDVGGTFTDCVALTGDGRVLEAKVPSTPDDPARGVIDGLQELARADGQELLPWVAGVERVLHGTTVATNAVLTGGGARTALLCTEGFRDTLAMREGIKEAQYDPRYTPPEPLVPRRLRLGVRERVDSAGEVVVRLETNSLEEMLQIFRREGVAAVAVCFLHSYANPVNEREVGAWLAAHAPDLYVTLSSDLLRQVRYYDRTSTTAFNAYVGPVIAGYVMRLAERLREAGAHAPLLVMQSSGGVVGAAAAARRGAGAILSGPAAGAITAAAHLSAHQTDACISVDMGGTSFDVALVRDGEPVFVPRASFDRRVVALPSVDIHTIGAGGGSIGWVDDGGLLRMGPQSAGAVPGPACYGLGGERPTCTDASLVLGLIDRRKSLIPGATLHLDLAANAIERDIAEPLEMTTVEAALGMHRVIEANMAMGVRAVSVDRGIDPREVPLVAGGGAGPLHAGRIAQELDIPLVIVPRRAGLLCALGMLLSDLRHDDARTYVATLADADFGFLETLVDAMSRDGDATLAAEGVPAEHRRFVASLDLRYAGQHRELEVECTREELSSRAHESIAARFEDDHERRYAHRAPGTAVEVVNVRVRSIGATRKLDLAGDPVVSSAGGPISEGTRAVYFEASGPVDVTVYAGAAFAPGHRVGGPALVDDATTTVFVPPDYQLLCDIQGSFVLAHETIADDVDERIATGAAER